MTSTTWPTFQKLLNAHRVCRRRKKPSQGQLRFEKYLSHNVLRIRRAIQTGTWQPQPYTSFVVLNPKPREIFAAHFADRVVHHLVVSELEKHWNPKFSPHSFACFKGRGPYAALTNFQKHVRSISRGGRRSVWVLQLDIANFFATINRPILEALVLPHIHNPQLATVVKTLLRHNPRQNHKPVSPEAAFAKLPQHKRWENQPLHCGLPIGNLTSQFFANVLLTALDHFIARTLKPQAYLRYMDDLTLLASTKEELAPFIEPISQWLCTHRQQTLNSQKTQLSNLRNGIEYLGFHIRQLNTPKNPAQLHLPANKKFKIVQAAQKLERQGFPPPQCLDPILHIFSNSNANAAFCSLNARLGQAKHAQTFRWRKGVLIKLASRQNIVVKKGYLAARPKE